MPIELTLGTANLGLAYGTAICRDLPKDDHVEAILRHARRGGFKAVDTAQAYGVSEMRIGRHLEIGEGFHRDEIGTKTAPFADLDSNSPSDLGRQLVQESLEASRAALKTQKLQRVMLHRASHFSDAGGSVWQHLMDERETGEIVEIGVSVQTLEEARDTLRRSDVDAMQLPCNILDWRFDGADIAGSVAARAQPIKIDARSVFLQGILACNNPSLFPALAVPYEPAGIVDWLRRTAHEFAGGALDALCLRYVASLDWVHAVVIGADTPAQVDRIAEIAQMELFPCDVMEAIRSTRPVVPEDLLNPSLWLPARKA